MKKIILLAAFGVAGLVSAKNGENLSLETKTTKEVSVSKKIEITKSTFKLGGGDMKCYNKTPDGGTVEVKCPDVIIIVKP
ncbi:hypothetical protein [Chryseobacterium sp.]|uniref:hypothetical protein n=1 Tax=Chryseobacterium sp. TaxID=1871047 RepID=UPI002FCC7C50